MWEENLFSTKGGKIEREKWIENSLPSQSVVKHSHFYASLHCVVILLEKTLY